MNTIKQHLLDIEESIKELPINPEEVDFSEKRLNKLGVIYGTISEIIDTLGKRNFFENHISDLKTRTIERILSIKDSKVRSELAYKRGEEIAKLDQIKSQPIEERFDQAFLEIVSLENPIDPNIDKISQLESSIDKFENIKLVMISLKDFIPEEHKIRISEKIKKYESYISKIT